MSHNPLDKLVAELVANAHYLTPDHQRQLAELIRDYLLANNAYDQGNKLSLRAQIESQMNLLTRMQMAVASSQDVSEMKSVMASGKAVLEMLQKLEKDLARESREKLLEDAVIESLRELGDDAIRVKFMNILRQKLARRDAQNGSK